MKKLVLQGSIILIGLLTAILSSISFERLSMNYNEQGVHFDEATLTTYNSQAQIFWFGATIASVILMLILVFRLKKLS